MKILFFYLILVKLALTRAEPNITHNKTLTSEIKIECIRFTLSDELAVGFDDGNIELWNLDTEDIVFETLEANDFLIDNMGKIKEKTLRMWLESKRIRQFNRDEIEALLAGDDPSKGHTKRVTHLENLKKGILVSASDDLKMKLWNLETRNVIKTLSYSYKVTSLAVLPDRSLVSAHDNENNGILIWNTATGNVIKRLKHEYPFIFKHLAVLPNGHLVSGTKYSRFYVWNTAASKIIQTITGNVEMVSLKTFNDGTIVAGNDRKSSVKVRFPNIELFNSNTGQETQKYFIPRIDARNDWQKTTDYQIPNALLVLDTNYFVSAHCQGLLHLWNKNKNNVSQSVREGYDLIKGLDLLSDRKFVSFSDYKINIWFY